jgi:hypothetical protein
MPGSSCAAILVVLAIVVVAAATVNWRGGASGFRPVPVSTCRGGPCDGPCSGGCGGGSGGRVWYDDQYAVEMGKGNGAALWDPYYGQSRIAAQCCPSTGREHAIGPDGSPMREGFAANPPMTQFAEVRCAPGCSADGRGCAAGPTCANQSLRAGGPGMSTCNAPYVPATSCGGAGTGPDACVTGLKKTSPFGCPLNGSSDCGAPRPGVTALDQYNPITGIGARTDVRRSAERYCRGAPLQRPLSPYELEPGQAGYVAPLNDEAGLSADLAHRWAMTPGLPPLCGVKAVDPDADFLTDGLFGAAILNGTTITQGGCSANSCGREGFTSSRRACANDLTDSRVGLGSVRMDPRFQPGWGSIRDTNPAPGTHAGGVTLGGLAPAVFHPVNLWGDAYVYGFGDMPSDSCSGQRTPPPEALITGDSRF